MGILIKKLRLYVWVTMFLPMIPSYCKLVSHHSANQEDAALHWLSRIIILQLIFLLSLFISIYLQGDLLWYILFLFLIIAVPIVMWRDLQNKVKQRRELILIELPTFMQKFILLVNAGETPQRAWVQAGTVLLKGHDHPLYRELMKTNMQLQQSVPFSRALEELHLRCGMIEFSSFITTVLMNYRRGGEAFTLAIHDAARMLLEKKRAFIRIKGEEASTKLIFPMLIMLLAVMVLVCAPAVMLMEG
jgi:tight adherence protein C